MTKAPKSSPKKAKPKADDTSNLDLDPDAWPKFEKLIKSAAKLGPINPTRGKSQEVTCDLISYLSGQSADSWIAVWTAALFGATVLLGIIALSQITTARTENRITQTLLACGQYDTSPVIFDCCKKVMAAKDAGTLEKDAYALRQEIMTILNFLDAIAIGVEQKLYKKALVKDHMQSIMTRHINELIRSPVGPASKCTPEHFPRLLALHDEWAKSP